MNMVYVASRFEFRRRRKPLSWSHHAEVAALPPDMQECWLDLAERERMSVRSLPTELRGARRASRGGEARRLAAAGATVGSVVCPRCNSVIELGGEGEPTPPAARLAAPILE